MNLELLAGVTKAFGRNHIITACVCIVLIIAAIIAITKTKIKFETILNIMLIIWVFSEIIKLCSNISYLLSDGTIVKIINYEVKEGIDIVRAFYPRTELPFHLCSIQPIFMLLVKYTKNIKLKETFLAFMFPTGILGALIAIGVDTVGCDFTNPQVYEYFIFHSALIVFAASIVIKKQIKITLKTHIKTLGLLIVMFVASIWLNTICSDTGANHVAAGVEDTEFYTNFFYSMKPPLEGLPLLNLDHGWFVYFLTVVVLGLVLITLFQLPFIISNYKKDKQLTNE